MKGQLLCPDCPESPLRRVSRSGLLQRKLFTWFGFYPWECGLCRKEFLFKQRYQYIKRRSTGADIRAAQEKVLVWRASQPGEIADGPQEKPAASGAPVLGTTRPSEASRAVPQSASW